MDGYAPSDGGCHAERRFDGHASRSMSRQRGPPRFTKASLALAVLAASVPVTMAQECVSLQGSSTCSAWSSASVSTGSGLTGNFPFLAFVSDVQSFDNRLREYIATDYARQKYQTLLGCSSVNLTNTTDIYARYTTSFLCNAIVQNSIKDCSLSDENSTPLCADSCAQFAISEQEIIASPELCGNAGNNAQDEIRSDFARCSLPSRALSGSCVDAVSNEPAECGYQSNLQGLCSFCATSSPNSTDSCCVNANVEARCQGVDLPTTTSMPPLFPSTTSVAPSGTSTAGAGGSGSGLSGGAIAGIVVGSLVGAALILAAVIFCCVQMRKRRQSQHGSILNTPSPTRQSVPGPPMSYGGDGHSPATILPGARVARMSALEGSSSSDRHSSRAGGVMGAYRTHDDAYESPDSGRSHLGGALPKREGSLSSHSALAVTSEHTSPHSGSNPDRNFSSPEGVASGQSEQLQFFKDYYSQDDIHPNDTVATLWAYQPRANDEFELERGDMLKVVGIWDDGWATGVKLNETAEQWEARRAVQRDSGVSNGSRQSRIEGESEIKAFPLVCVCLPQHWRKTIEGDSTDTGAGSGVASSSSPSPVGWAEPVFKMRPSSPLASKSFTTRIRHSKTPPPYPGLNSSGSSTLINTPHRI